MTLPQIFLKKRPRVKAVFFDIGNVILYFDNHLVSRRLSQITGRSEADLFNLVFGLYAQMELDLGKTSMQEFLKILQKELELKLGNEELNEIFSDIFTDNPQMRHLIYHLKRKVKVIAVSNTNQSHFEFILKKFPILHELEHLVVSFQIGVKKPHPGIYFEALRLAEANPQDCLFIDDQMKNLIPASLLGFKTHFYRRHEKLLEALLHLKVL